MTEMRLEDYVRLALVVLVALWGAACLGLLISAVSQFVALRVLAFGLVMGGALLVHKSRQRAGMHAIDSEDNILTGNVGQPRVPCVVGAHQAKPPADRGH